MVIDVIVRDSRPTWIKAPVDEDGLIRQRNEQALPQPQMCAGCGRQIVGDPAVWHGERYCEGCEPALNRDRVVPETSGHIGHSGQTGH